MARAHDGAVAGGPGDPVAPRPSLADPDRVMQADRVRDAALIVLRRDDPNLVGEVAGDLFEDFETRRFNTIVISYENTIQHSAAPLFRKSYGPGLSKFFFLPQGCYRQEIRAKK
jgi:hypothetical protein